MEAASMNDYMMEDSIDSQGDPFQKHEKIEDKCVLCNAEKLDEEEIVLVIQGYLKIMLGL